MLCEPPYTERYVRWCEGTVDKLIVYLLLDSKKTEGNACGIGYADITLTSESTLWLATG